MSKRTKKKTTPPKTTRLTHKQAAAKGNFCPYCGLVSYDPEPMEYECPSCGKVGYDCCVMGNNCICTECEE
jgi:ribosomal protein L32